MLYIDLNYVNVDSRIEVYIRYKFENWNFQSIYLNLIISLIDGANVIKVSTLVVL